MSSVFVRSRVANRKQRALVLPKTRSADRDAGIMYDVVTWAE